ncbi:YfhO family protein [Ferruginibacter yonginensis]|uniref:YfhO family protein n=1 Tax=Ferruginibacter yonginensis TaxID=1310416 RepID=A0ABV8QN06_9BACT
MKNFDFKKLVPHFIAIAVFLLVTIIFCKPALESGVVLKQSDISSWQGMSHQSMEYKEKNGHLPLWVTSMFSGMPAYQIAIEGAWSPLQIFDKAFQLWLPKPMNFFFLACISFYFLCICLRIRSYAAIIGALAFAYCTYSPIIITAGHDTKMLTLAYTPALIGAVILLLKRHYFLGFSLTALFTALQVGQGHQQVSYYAFMILLVMTLFFIVNAFKNKQTVGLVKSVGLLLAAGLMGIAVNAITLFPTYDYAKYSKRGGQLILDENNNKAEKTSNGKTNGLSKDYAFQWSYGRAETMSLMFPGVKGYGLYFAQRDGETSMFPMLNENAKVVSYMTSQFPQAPADQIAQQMSQSLYWGDQPFTSGPVYLGAIICFLFIMGMFYLDGEHKWWIFTASLLGILLALGSNFDTFNTFMFNYFPLYNKFRVPTIALVIPQILAPLMAVLVVNKLLHEQDEKETWAKFKLATIATGVLFVIGLGFYATSSFGNENTARTSAFNKLWESKPADFQAQYAAINEQYKPQRDNQVYENWVIQLQQSPDAIKVAREIVVELKKDRASLLLRDIFRSFIYVLFAVILIGAYIRKKISATIMLAGVTLASAIDLISLDFNYLNAKSFETKDNYEQAEFAMSAADRRILEDKDPNYRVFNASVSSPFEESRTSYYHKSIGGYHAAKMGIYDDLSAYQMSGRPNQAVLNMLNAKWFIVGEGDKIQALQNPEALGNAWFVKNVRFVDGPAAEMKALTNLNTKDSAVADASYKDIITNYTAPDSLATIKMTQFDNDAITYESNSTSNNAAIFSEIYYKDWNAYIDGNKVPIFKANYVLRGLIIPAGKHKIEFKFEPTIFYTSKKVSDITNWVLFILILAAIALEIRKQQKSAV